MGEEKRGIDGKDSLAFHEILHHHQ